jgi:NADPH2:quinone reductase
MAYTSQRPLLEAMSARLFEVVGSGTVSIEIDQRYALDNAVQAHLDLEARKTTGSTILIP